MLRFNSVRFKISILYTAILGLILLIYSVFLYLSLHYTLYGELDRELDIKATEITSFISSYLDILGHDRESFDFAVKMAIHFDKIEPLEENEIGELEKLWLNTVDKLNLKEDYISIIHMATGKLAASSSNLPGGLVLMELNAKNARDIIYANVRYDKRTTRVISMPFSCGRNENYVVQVGTSLKPVIELLQNRLLHIVCSIPIILIFASFLGRLFVKRTLATVADITKTASKITHEDLSSRVKTEHVDEEMKYLVNAFNDMISRLEESFKYIAEFSSHVAHELKTPLAIIKGESEVTLRKERTVEEYKGLIRISLEEVERMLRTINGLLLLARLDYKPDALVFEQVNLVELLKEISEQARILSCVKDIGITVNFPEEEKHIMGDRFHLRRMFFNLLDNAIKFTPEKGSIDLSLKYADKEAIVLVSDTGIGIPESDIPRIFDRFYRVDIADQKIAHGAGLGLSIAISIARLHNGDISAESKPPAKGTTFAVTLPLL